MYQSILQFIEKDIKEIEKSVENLLEGKKDAAELSEKINESTRNLAAQLVGEIYETIDKEIRDSITRKEKWRIEKRNEPKELLDIMGTVRFHRTGYEDKKTGEYIYLLDRVLGIDGHQRITLGAAARILEETIQTSYRKGGEAASPLDAASKQAVKRLVHETVVDMPLAERKERKKQRYLHIVADEDHVSAQFWKEKGDLEKNEHGYKNNTILSKLICVYEEVVDDGKEGSGKHRYRLTGKHYFCGVHKGTAENERFWQDVNDYIEANYDTEVLERVYIAGDGAAWIKAGCDVLENSRFVLDKFHMMKYVNQSVTHLKDSADDVRSEIWEYLNGGHKEELKKLYQRILAATKKESKVEAVKESLAYFLNQWDGIKIRVEEAGGCWKCCAEGQISHILSSRMSSRPMGWSILGCHQMSKLRAYQANGGKIIDLLRYQEKQQEIEEGRREQESLIKELRSRRSGWDYAEQLQARMPALENPRSMGIKGLIRRALGA